MPEQAMTHDEASALFIQEVVQNAYVGAISGTLKYLRSGPPGGRPSPKLITLHKWYLGLSEIDKTMVADLLSDCTMASVFHFCGVLDGVTGSPLDGRQAIFSVYLRVYDSAEDEKADRAAYSVRISNAGVMSPDLHDLAKDAIEDLGTVESILGRSLE